MVEREDYAETPPKGYFRLFPGNEVRLRFGFVVKCLGMENGIVKCHLSPDFKIGHPRRRQVQGEGQHPLGERAARARAEVRLYDRLYKVPQPDAIED